MPLGSARVALPPSDAARGSSCANNASLESRTPCSEHVYHHATNVESEPPKSTEHRPKRSHAYASVDAERFLPLRNVTLVEVRAKLASRQATGSGN